MLKVVRASLAALETNISNTKMPSPAAGWARTKNENRQSAKGRFFICQQIRYTLWSKLSFLAAQGKKSSQTKSIRFCLRDEKKPQVLSLLPS